MKKADIILKINLSLVIVFCFHSCVFTQAEKDNLTNYEFEYLGGCDKHVVHRTFLTDTTFIEKTTISYFENQYTVIDTFMLGKEEWYYLHNGEWLPYFSKSKFQEKRKLVIWGESKIQPGTIATPVKMDTIGKKEVYVYRLRSPNDVEANKTLYFFDFDLGVVKIIETGYEPPCREKTSSLIKNW